MMHMVPTIHAFYLLIVASIWTTPHNGDETTLCMSTMVYSFVACTSLALIGIHVDMMAMFAD